MKINLIDLTGKSVLGIASGSFLSFEKTVDVSRLSKGLYILNVSLDGEKLKARKIVIQ